MNTEETLQTILRRLGESATPFQIIDELLPRNRTDAMTWARHLLLWDEFKPRTSEQAVALARIVSQCAMDAFHLTVTEQGQILDRSTKWRTPRSDAVPATIFVTIAGEELRVDYRPDYFPFNNQDHFEFKSPHEPSQPHLISETGYKSHFASSDAVKACGGPAPYAQLYAEAVHRGQEVAFADAFKGKPQEPPRKRRGAKRGAKQPIPELTTESLESNTPPCETDTAEKEPTHSVIGKHTQRIRAEIDTGESPEPPTQRSLF